MSFLYAVMTMWLSDFTHTPQKEEHTEQRNKVSQNKDLRGSICNTEEKAPWNTGDENGANVPLVSFKNELRNKKSNAQHLENIETVPQCQLFHIKQNKRNERPSADFKSIADHEIGYSRTPIHILSGHINPVAFEEACHGELISCPQYHWHWLYKSWCIKRCTQRHKDCIFEHIKNV